MKTEIRIVPFVDFNTVNRLQAQGFRFGHEANREHDVDQLAFAAFPDGPRWILHRELG
jgi:hypothetical protein